jgi:hypothetical protein
MMRADPGSAFNRVMLRSTRRGFFRHSYDISEDGQPTAALTGIRREGHIFDVDGHSYRVTRDGSKAFTLSGPNGDEARAERVRGRTWTISSLVVPLELVRTSVWKDTWELRRFGEPVGTLAKDGAFKRTSTADLPNELPLPLRLFVLCVVETLWERARQSEGAGGSAAVFG